MLDKLERVLASDVEEREETVDRNLFTRICMPQDVYDKMVLYAKLGYHRGGDAECYGFLLGSSNRMNRIIEDVYFAPDQDNNPAHTEISGESVIKVGRLIREMGKRVMGWWHSHAGFQPFHSSEDNGNLVTVLDQVAPTNYIIAYEDYRFLSEDIKKTLEGDDRLVICDRKNSSRRLEMVFSEKQENPLTGVPLKEILIRIPKQISYAYSIVTNANGDKPYVEMIRREFCGGCKRDETIRMENFPFSILNYKIGVEIDEAKMKAEVKSKVKIRSRKYFKGFEGLDDEDRKAILRAGRKEGGRRFYNFRRGDEITPGGICVPRGYVSPAHVASSVEPSGKEVDFEVKPTDVTSSDSSWGDKSSGSGNEDNNKEVEKEAPKTVKVPVKSLEKPRTPIDTAIRILGAVFGADESGEKGGS